MLGLLTVPCERLVRMLIELNKGAKSGNKVQGGAEPTDTFQI